MKDQFTRKWIVETAVPIIDTYERGVLTLRGLHYRLVGEGMTNTLQHYKRVVSALIKARWDGVVAFEAFSDHDRGMLGETDFEITTVDARVEEMEDTINYWLNNYSKNRWENQPIYPEVFIEKKALQGVFQETCNLNSVALGACKGYPSLTFLNDAAKRFICAVDQGKKPIILYFGDYDPSGEDIPRSINENIQMLGCEDIEVRRFALMEDQVREWNLPPAPVKVGDSRSANWDGLGQVELDAIMPDKLAKLCEDAIDSVFDRDLFNDLEAIQREEKKEYRVKIKEIVLNNLKDEAQDEDE